MSRDSGISTPKKNSAPITRIKDEAPNIIIYLNTLDILPSVVKAYPRKAKLRNINIGSLAIGFSSSLAI
jgi:hypothetical protein